MNLPDPLPETSGISAMRQMARAFNKLREAVRAREVRESPHTRIERSAGGGTHVHVKPSSSSTTAGGARWL